MLNPELWCLKGKILTINKGSVKQEILLSGKWQQINGTNYSVRYFSRLTFRVAESRNIKKGKGK